MFWWWIGNLVLLFVVLPVVVWLLNRVLAPIERIRVTVDDILRNAVTLTGEIDDLPELLDKTDRTVHEVGVGATRYVKGLVQSTS